MFNDLRYAFRQLLKSPGFTAVAVLTLALGIGLNAGIFTILNAVALRPLRVQRSERLVCVFQDFSRNRGRVLRNVYDDANRASYSEYREYQDNNHVFSGLVAYAPSVPATLGGERPQQIVGTLASGNYFEIGKTLRQGAYDLEVVGVARDAQVSHLARSDEPYVYLPAGPKEQSDLQFLAHSASGYATTAASIQATVRALDAELTVNIARLEDNFEYFRFPGRVLATLSAVLGVLALVLALIGVYGMVSYAVSQRVREIGIRMALGADAREVMALILRQAMRPVAVGMAIGIVGCAAASSILSGVLYGISPHDPVSFLFVPGFLLAVALLASYLPARSAAKVDPMEALRYE